MGNHSVDYGSRIIDGGRIETAANDISRSGISLYLYYVRGVCGIYKDSEEGKKYRKILKKQQAAHAAGDRTESGKGYQLTGDCLKSSLLFCIIKSTTGKRK